MTSQHIFLAAYFLACGVALVWCGVGLVRSTLAYRRAQREAERALDDLEAMLARHAEELPRTTPLAELCDDEKRGDDGNAI